jgi:antitoxin VapB
MTLQIADSKLVATAERLAKRTGWTTAVVVERALDGLAERIEGRAVAGRMAAILAQLDRLPDRIDAYDPIDWNEGGPPR